MRTLMLAVLLVLGCGGSEFAAAPATGGETERDAGSDVTMGESDTSGCVEKPELASYCPVLGPKRMFQCDDPPVERRGCVMPNRESPQFVCCK